MRCDIPFYGNTNDDTHCFQAALRMALGYFYPRKSFSFEMLDEISGKGKDMWTWPYAAMIWLVQRGFVVKNIELFDTPRFAQEGYAYLVSFFGEDVAAVQAAHADIALEQKRASESVRYIQFEKRIPALSEVKKFLLRGFVVLCSVNSRVLREKEGYIGHAVVVTEVTVDEVVFHDPGLPHRPFARASHELFEKAWGYPRESAKNILALRKRNLFERGAIFCTTLPIRIYQKTLSYDHGPMKVFYPHGFCQFYPSCSEYNVWAIEKYGVVHGILKGLWRIFRCHPWAKGGVDEP